MGGLTRNHVLETAVWLLLALGAFALSFQFNKVGEIYPPGPSAWPRVIIALTVIAALGNLYYHWKNGDALQEGRIGLTRDEETLNAERSLSATLRIAAILLIPFLFAVLLKPVGFYCATPFFIVAIIMLMGERRAKHIIIITALIYLLLVIFFLVLLNANLPQGTVSPFYDISNQFLIWNQNLKDLF